MERWEIKWAIKQFMEGMQIRSRPHLTRRQLLKAPMKPWQEHRTYRTLYLVPSGKLHDSGYMCIALVGEVLGGPESFQREIRGPPRESHIERSGQWDRLVFGIAWANEGKDRKERSQSGMLDGTHRNWTFKVDARFVRTFVT